MRGRQLGETLLHRLKLSLAPSAWRVLTATIRIPRSRRPPGPQSSPVIFACLHRDIIPAIMYVQPLHPTLVVSQSPDGDILIRTLRAGGYRFIRGSTGQTGVRAFVGLLAELRQGYHVGLAVDGPKGPFGVIHDGVIQLSRRSQRPIVPLVISSQRYWELGTWDRTVVPWPFSRVEVLEAEPLLVPAQATIAEMDSYRRQVAAALLGFPTAAAEVTPLAARQSQDGGEPCLP